MKCVEKRPFSSLGFFKENWFKELTKGFLIGAAQFSLIVVLLLLTGLGRLELNHLSLEPLLFIIALIPFWILQGGTEELVTRGWLFPTAVSYTHLRAHETRHDLVCRLLLEKKKTKRSVSYTNLTSE